MSQRWSIVGVLDGGWTEKDPCTEKECEGGFPWGSRVPKTRPQRATGLAGGVQRRVIFKTKMIKPMSTAGKLIFHLAALNRLKIPTA